MGPCVPLPQETSGNVRTESYAWLLPLIWGRTYGGTWRRLATSVPWKQPQCHAAAGRERASSYIWTGTSASCGLPPPSPPPGWGCSQHPLQPQFPRRRRDRRLQPPFLRWWRGRCPQPPQRAPRRRRGRRLPALQALVWKPGRQGSLARPSGETLHTTTPTCSTSGEPQWVGWLPLLVREGVRGEGGSRSGRMAPWPEIGDGGTLPGLSCKASHFMCDLSLCVLTNKDA